MTVYSSAIGLGKGCRTIHPDPPSSGNRPRPGTSGTSKVVAGRLRQLWPWFTADGMCHAIAGPRSATAWFEWVLSPDGWSNVEGLLEPFTESDTSGFQWLTNRGRVAVLILGRPMVSHGNFSDLVYRAGNAPCS